MSFAALRGAARLRTGSTRAFSTSQCLLRARGEMPTFHNPSSPELAAMYENVRETILIPAFLYKQHRNLVYRPKNHKLLTDPENSVIVNLGGQDIQLTPRPPSYEPPPRKTFTDALNLMKTDEDLNNLPNLITAYAVGNLPLRDSQWEKVARTCSLRGRTDLLLKIARAAKEHPNQIKFNKALAREFMRGFLLQNQIPKLKDECKRSLKGIQHFIEIIGAPENKVSAAERLRHDPAIVGMELHAYASASKRFNDGKDYKHFAKTAATRFVEVWNAGVPELRETVKNDASGRNRVKEMCLDFRPVMEGLVVARDILKGTDLETPLKKHEKKIREALEVWEAFLARQEMPVNRNWKTYKQVAAELGKKRTKVTTKEAQAMEQAENEGDSEVAAETEAAVEEEGEVKA